MFHLAVEPFAGDERRPRCNARCCTLANRSPRIAFSKSNLERFTVVGWAGTPQRSTPGRLTLTVRDVLPATWHQLEESRELHSPTCKEVGCSASLLRMAPACLQAAQVYARPLHPSAKGVRLWASSATWSGERPVGNLRSSSCTLHGKPWS